LKEYAYKYFEKVGETKLEGLYREVFKDWIEAFNIKTNEDMILPDPRSRVVSLLKTAYENEKEAVRIMESLTA
jgi:hypothetical protein